MEASRLKALQKTLNNPILIKKKENLLYLTGRSFMHGYLLIKPLTPALSRKGRGGEVVFLGDGLEKIEGVKTDFLKNVGKYISKKEVLEIFGEFTYAEAKYIRAKNKDLRLKITVKHDPVDYQRVIKEPEEIENVKKSMQIVERVFKLVRGKLKDTDGKRINTEIGLAKFIETSGLKMGANDLAFPAIVASGPNAAIPHHVPSSKKIKSNESIILDFGFKYKNYCSDFTRTVFLKSAPKRLAEAYNQTEKAYNGSIKFCNTPSLTLPTSDALRGRESKPFLPLDGGGIKTPSYNKRGLGGDITGNDVYQKSVSILKEKHLEKYFIHSLGHGTGLEIHELPNLSPNSKDVLKDNMIFSIEPGVYIPKVGGIRIEDLVYLQGGKVKKFINISTKLEDNVI